MNELLQHASQWINGKLPWPSPKTGYPVGGRQAFPGSMPPYAPNMPPLPQPLPRDVLEKRLPVKALSNKPKRPEISLTPDEIRHNPHHELFLQQEEAFLSTPWNFSNQIDPYDILNIH